MSSDLWRRVLAVDLDAPMLTMLRALREMITQGGGAIVDGQRTSLS